MENFSTPRTALVPVAANLLTLLALVCTTWWSSHNRPVSTGQPRAVMAGQATKSAAPVNAAAAVLQPHDDGTDAQAPGKAALTCTTLDRDSLRTVGFLADVRR